MDQDRIFILLARYVSGEANAEEQEELEWAFLANPDLLRMATQLQKTQQLPPKGISTAEEQQMLERGLEKFARKKEPAETASEVLANVGPPPPQLPLTRRIGSPARWIAAASILLFLTGALFYFHGTKPSAPGRVPPGSIATGRGARRYMKLPDGSQLWLNAGSRIVFAGNFSADKRELTLEGEAFFDVKHDQQHPFLIHAGRLNVKVLGTTLNVKAYPGDSSTETTLITGKVEIGIAGNPQSSIVLHPNEKVIIPVYSTAFMRRPVVPDQTDGTITETSWVKNRLVFRNETLAGMTARLERWYAVKIIFDNDRYQQDTISGTFPDVPIGDVMHALQITAGFHYQIAKDTVRIW